MPSVKIIIATHKKYRMPDDEMYVPVQVGAEGKDDLGYTRDNTGDNISSLNPQFCELTGLYWAWKNLDADYVGLAHYRRHFRGKKKTKDPFDCVLTSKEAEELLKEEKEEYIIPLKITVAEKTVSDLGEDAFPNTLIQRSKSSSQNTWGVVTMNRNAVITSRLVITLSRIHLRKKSSLRIASEVIHLLKK